MNYIMFTKLQEDMINPFKRIRQLEQDITNLEFRVHWLQVDNKSQIEDIKTITEILKNLSESVNTLAKIQRNRLD